MIRSIFSSSVFSGLVLFVLTIAAPAGAIETPHTWAGTHYGVAVPNADGTSARPMMGFTAGTKLGTEMGLGAYYFGSHKDETPLGRYDYDLYGIELGYHFEGEAAGAFVGARLGISKVTTATTVLSSSPLHFGLVGGYDYMIMDHLSVGAEANFFSIQAGGGVGGFTSLDFLASLKIWL